MSNIVLPSVITASVVVLLLIWKLRNMEKNDVSKYADIVTIIIGISTAVTSIVSVVVMLRQDNIQRQMMESQQKEHQPVFSISHNLSKSDLSDVYDIEDFIIENRGESMLAPAELQLRTFIKVEYMDRNNNYQCSTYYPLAYYYNAQKYTDNLSGVLFQSFGNEYLQNHLSLYNIDRKCIASNMEKEKVYVEIRKVDFFIISYKDIYGIPHTSYFRDNNISTKDDYELVCRKAADTYGSRPQLSISELTLEDLITPILNKL